MQARPGLFSERLGEGPLDDERETGRRLLERVCAALKARAGSAPEPAFSPQVSAFLCGVFAGSSFLFGLAERDPQLLVTTLETAPEAEFEEILSRTAREASQADSQRDIMRILRQGKTGLAFLIALADLADIWTVEEVTRRLSEAADVLVGAAVRFLLRRAAQGGQFRPRDPANPEKDSGLVILGMGKYGAHELNYSSDIDLIVFFDREIAPLAADVEPGPFFVRFTRDFVHIMQESTADGYVFRTDLRLRPDPGSTQAAISTEAAFRYYESLGQNWERAALIKARPVAGDIAAGDAFLKALSPYIWRKYLDYNAIADIHAMKRQIHAAKGHRRIAIAGHNLKLGRGGIREIEFFVQSQQLIAGGRQPALRTRQTLAGLDLLTGAHWIGEPVRDDLARAYRFLRRMEHRLQMMADQQTHTLPSDAEELAKFARFAGYRELDRFKDELRRQMQNVETHYAALFESTPELTPKRVKGNLVFTGDAEDPGTAETLSQLGFKNPATAISAVKGWHYGRYKAMQSERAREILTEFTPALLEALGDTSDPDLALATFDTFLSESPSALQLFSMLRANPSLLRLLAQIMGSAPRLARILGRRRRLMDAILDPGYIGARPAADELKALIRREIMEAGSYEEKLNRARVTGQEQAFAIGVRLLSRQLTPQQAGEDYSLVAEAVIEALLDTVQEQYGAGFPAPAVIGMGKLGGREMAASSDLDLIVVYDTLGDAAPQASQHYARFTQRLIAAIAAPTPEGVLYPVDMRLRPSGKAGPVAVRLDGFLAYQQKSAWTWEHLALTRARPVAGPLALRERLAADIRQVLTMPRDRAKTAADVREMRALIEAGKGTADIWQTKTHKGGLVDAEFIAQFLQIVHAAGEPAILSPNTARALANLMQAGILSAADGNTLLRAAGLYQDIAQILRLCTEDRFDPQTAPKDLIGLLLQATGEPDIERLEARLDEAYAGTARLFSTLIV
ncbi:MAG: bifunctional [glutamine synthetase] adenylyltransferase/[glutamine synthetase]-adenylyl-L-tyrosine phosphorylase [Rhodomicrobium sp.]